jgi:tol-pal system protein YbgF
VVEQEHKRAAFDSRPIELYNKAYGLLQKKKHAEAIAAFEKFLDEYPNHDYSDNALYWMGEAYYDVQDYRSALECFDKLVTIYPDGNKVPDAMLKAALCRCNVGQATEGKERLQQVIREFPGTHAAVVARQKLEAHQCAGTASEDGIPLEE